MSSGDIKYGRVGWIDLTVSNAEEIRDFYSKVAGWYSLPVDLGDYQDYVMTPGSEEDAAAGICHSLGTNKGLPSCWMIYINVRDINKSISECLRLGGKQVTEIKTMGNYGKYAVICDPSGAYCALFEPAV